MNVLFVCIGPDHSYPVTVGALSSYLKRSGHATRLLDIVTVHPALNENELALLEKELDTFKPRLVGFTVFETGFHWVKQVCDFIKKKDPSIVTIAGGYYPTLTPEEVISCDSVDVVCVGEGERALLELANAMDSGAETKNISNLWVKENGEVFKNKVGPLIEDLDELPFWDRDMFDFQAQINSSSKGDRNVKVMASRGCPYQCTYCSSRFFREMYSNKNKYLRMRSVGHLIDELVELKNNFDFDYVGFHDDNLTIFPEWLEEFSGRYKSDVGVRFYCAARPETCTDKNLDFLKQAGCFMVLIGIECGDESYRKTEMKRKMSNKLILDVSRRIKERGMLLWTFNMVGMPGETRANVLKTALLNWRIGPDFAMTSIYYPFRGTEMGDKSYNEGLVNIKKKGLTGYFANDSILDHPNLTGFEMKIFKYLTIFSAIRSRSGYFHKDLLARAKRKLAFLSGGLIGGKQA
ncbi:MAG: B12-binding domain-containing radical SAM protein [Proteobacteria bacterium]|nr:B12-binding domain-containing radical SAM protein [Pseudomonadota bacterium]